MKPQIYKQLGGSWALIYGSHGFATFATWQEAMAELALVRPGARLEPTC